MTGVPPVNLCYHPYNIQLYLGGNNFSCSPSCQMDNNWLQGHTSSHLMRCYDQQDIALYELNKYLKVSDLLNDQIYIYESNIDTSNIITYNLSYPNAFKYDITISQQLTTIGGNCNIYYLVCTDVSCNHVLFTYDGSGKPTFTAQTNILYFHCVGCTDCTSRWYYSINLQATYRMVSNWNFLSTLPYSTKDVLPHTVSYANGLCRELWQGVQCSFGSIIDLKLSNLGLSGMIPSTIGLLSHLSAIDLSFNKINGNIPSSISYLTNLISINFKSNNLNQTIPISFIKLTNLISMDLSNNQISGSIPVFLIQNLTSLIQFDLNDNNLYGVISSELCNIRHQNITLILTNNNHLKCISMKCVNTNYNFLKLYYDNFLPICNDLTYQPTTYPTVAAVNVIHTNNNTPVLTTLGTILVSTFGSTLLLLILFITFRLRYSTDAIKRRKHRKRLKALPIHKALYEMKLNKDKLLITIKQNIETAKLRDSKGRTAFDIILIRKYRKHVNELIIYELLKNSLPINMNSGEEYPPTEHNFEWSKAIQHEHHKIVSAVKFVLDLYGHRARELAYAVDAKGRKCRDIACAKSKRALLLKLYLHERYELKEGPPEHKSATSVVYFAMDHKALAIQSPTTISPPSKSLNPTSPMPLQRINSLKSALFLSHTATNVKEEPSTAKKLQIIAEEDIDDDRSNVEDDNQHEEELEHQDDEKEDEDTLQHESRQVVLKFMRYRDQYLREIETRKKLKLNNNFIIPIITTYDGDEFDDENKAFRQDVITKKLFEDDCYSYCIVMEAASQSLKRFIDQQHVAGIDWNEIRYFSKQITNCLSYLHENGIIHGDLKRTYSIYSNISF